MSQRFSYELAPSVPPCITSDLSRIDLTYPGFSKVNLLHCVDVEETGNNMIDFYRLRKRKHQCSWNLHWNPQAAQTRAPVLLECTLNLYFLLRSRFFRIVQEGMTMSLEILC